MMRERLRRTGTEHDGVPDAGARRSRGRLQSGGGQRALSSVVGPVLEALRQGSPDGPPHTCSRSRSLESFSASQRVSDRIVRCDRDRSTRIPIAGNVAERTPDYPPDGGGRARQPGSDPGGAEFASILRAALEAASRLPVESGGMEAPACLRLAPVGAPSAIVHEIGGVSDRVVEV